RYNLSKNIATTLVGVRSQTEIETAAKVGINYKELTPIEQKQFTFKLNNYCRDCALCLPCPEKINIPATLRFNSFYTIYGLKNWATKLYSGLEVKSNKCTQCGLCQQKCPYNLPIKNMLKETHEQLSV
ncbi:MAG: 4Fe-4S dicluster domain-containing protein, partial [Candidatus Bathyarchaeota archaeon]|nr:4Fe-4S dicluster domain-containing protein [Candidatus Termiticorpusculum sp.]MCL2868718.1 4Fe-4S dicluster domain-containing protein [Candidatus Termiticorpusculum sp.]